MLAWLPILVLAAGVIATFYFWRNLQTRRLALERLDDAQLPTLEEDETADDEVESAPVQLFARRHWVLPWVAALALFAVLYWWLRLDITFSAAFGFIVGLMGMQIDGMLLARATDRIEIQLADAIDLMISSLKVGSTLQSAMDHALTDARRPLKPQLEEMTGRIRLGDNPKLALDALAARVPLETFHLFAMTLAVHWDVGGSLSQTLATVGRTIRNRIEISRRLRAITSQSRVSIVAIMLVTYFIAALMWRNNPDRMSEFLSTSAGHWLVSIAIVLQGVGILWISALSRVRF
jgi:Flp pilus assembly protein TadB